MYDRYWRLRVAGALVCGTAAAGFAAWYIVYVLPIDLRAGKLAFTGILAAVDVVFVLLGIALYQLLTALPQRQRQRLRQEAMSGNQDAIPLARPLLSGPNDASKSDEPFVVKFTSAGFQWLGAIVLLVFLVGITWIFIAAELQDADFPGLSVALMCPYGQEPYCAGTLARLMFLNLLLVPGGIFLWGYLAIEILRTFSDEPLRLGVRAEGLILHRMVGRSNPIPWSEMRLLEVWPSSAQRDSGRSGFRSCTIFTDTRQFSWTIADGGAKSRATTRLTTAILAHTGLRERTFDSTLIAPDVGSPRLPTLWSKQASSRFVTIVVGIAVLLGTVAFLPVVAPRDQTNADIALVVTIVVLVFSAVTSFRSPKNSASAPGGTARVSVAPSDNANFVIHPAATYEMTVGSYPLFKINQIMFALVGVCTVVVGAALLINQFDGALWNKNSVPLVPVSLLGTGILIGVIALGLATCIVAVRARDTIMLAELNGVRKRWMLGNVYIPWERVERVERKRYWGAPGYRIVSNAPKQVIQWPIQPFQPSRKSQEAGAILSTPDQMALVVSQRSGKALPQSVTSEEPEMVPEVMPAEAIYELSTKTSSTNWNRAWVGGLGLFIAGSAAGLLGLEGAEYLLAVPGYHPAPLWLMLALVGAVPVGVWIIIAALRYKSRLIVADAQGLQIRGMFGTTRIPWDEIGEITLHYVLGRPGYYVVMDDTARRGVSWVRSVLPQQQAQTNGAMVASAAQMAAVISQRSGQPIREINR